MPEGPLLDLLLVLLLVGYLVYGYLNGFVRSLGTIVGIAAGVVAAFFAVPLVGSWVPSPVWRIAATVAVAVGLVLAGHAAGAAVGHAIRRRVERTPLRVIDRVLGAAVTGIAAALVASVLAFSVGSLGVPLLSRAIATSAVLRAIDTLTPDPVQAFLAQLRSITIDEGLPRIFSAFGGAPPAIPSIETNNPALAVAAQSVVRITGNAYACGQSQSGSGFVVSTDRVVTNAHVVAGVSEPVIELPSGEVLAGRVVYFDPLDDLAVIAVDGMSAAPLQLTVTLSPGSAAVVNGYPYGGPFTSTAAEVISVDTAQVDDIYGTSTSPREVYTLAADVREGNSGGPLLAESGAVTGVIFARSAESPTVGYAMTMAELTPVAAEAPSLGESVSSGECIGG